jgi:preprotein translocase subunit SecG
MKALKRITAALFGFIGLIALVVWYLWRRSEPGEKKK